MEITNTRVTEARPPEAAAQRIYLMEIAGARIGAVHQVRDARTVLGRGVGAQIHLVDDGVSREHAELVLDGERVLVRDLASTNGTFINGARTTSREVRPGDQLSVGAATFVVFSHIDGLEAELPRGRAAAAGAPSPSLVSAQRESFVARISEEISFSRRHGEAIAVLAWELADSARLSERLGRAGFAATLDAARAAASSALRPGDLLAPIGGGRFAILLRRTPIRESATRAFDLRDAVARAAATDGTRLDLRVGVAAPTGGTGKAATNAASTLAAAESALAQAVARGIALVQSA